MDKSVEHILLRLLTPAFLVFLAGHLLAGILDVRATPAQPSSIRHAFLFLETHHGLAKVVRPDKVELRKPRVLEQRPARSKPPFLEVAAAYIAVLLRADEPRDQAAYVAPQVEVPSLFTRARARNPRDPPGLLA
jgi:hypothetical protein